MSLCLSLQVRGKLADVIFLCTHWETCTPLLHFLKLSFLCPCLTPDGRRMTSQLAFGTTITLPLLSRKKALMPHDNKIISFMLAGRPLIFMRKEAVLVKNIFRLSRHVCPLFHPLTTAFILGDGAFGVLERPVHQKAPINIEAI